jgi:hypothetical protein
VSFAAHADTLSQNVDGTGLLPEAVYGGQSFTMGGNGTYSNISFNFYTAGMTPYAAGKGYLFSTMYTGSALNLGASDAGYLGETTASGGFYQFGPQVSLTAGQTYYFYENALLELGAISGANEIAGGNFFYAQADGWNYTLHGLSANFTVKDGPAPAPEPSTFALLGTGLLSVAGVLRRRMRA